MASKDTPVNGCSADIKPVWGSACDQEGKICDYGYHDCCGETYPEITMRCSEGVWESIYYDSICRKGDKRSEKCQYLDINKFVHI